MKALIKFVVTVVLSVSLAACTGGTLRIDPIKNVADLDLSKGRKITASASGFQLFTALPTNASSRHARAYQALRDQAYDEAITDITIRESWSYAFIGTVYTTTIEAMAYPRGRNSRF